MSVYLSHHDDVSMAFEVWSGAAPLEQGLLRDPIDLRIDPPADRSGWIRKEIARLLDDCAGSVSYLSDIDPASLSVCYQCEGTGAIFWLCDGKDCSVRHGCDQCNGAGGKSKPCWLCGGSGQVAKSDAVNLAPVGKPVYGLDPSLVSVSERVLGRCVWRCVVRAGLPWWFGVSEIGAVLLMPCRNVVLPMRPATPETVRCEVKYRFRELRGTRAAGQEWTIGDSRIGELTRVEAPAKVPKAEKAKEVKP